MRRSPGFRAPAVVAAWLPDPEESIDAISPIRRVRHGHNETSIGTEHSERLGDSKLRREQMLEHLGADDNVEGRVRERERGCVIDLDRLKPSLPRELQSRPRNVDPDVGPGVFRKIEARGPTVSTPKVEAVVVWFDVPVKQRLQRLWRSISARTVARLSPVVVVVISCTHPLRSDSSVGRCLSFALCLPGRLATIRAAAMKHL